MKLLQLISGKQVRTAPGVKIIPQSEFSKLVDASQLIDQIKQEGIDHRTEIALEGEKLFEKSKQEGFQAGLEQWAEQIKLLEQEKLSVRKEVEKVIAKIAMITTKKVLDRELKQDPATVVDIIAKNLKSVANHRKISLFVNKKDLDLFQQHKERLKLIFDQVDIFNIVAREDISEGGAIIETEAGIIDARIENLWTTIENTFEDLINKNK